MIYSKFTPNLFISSSFSSGCLKEKPKISAIFGKGKGRRIFSRHRPNGTISVKNFFLFFLTLTWIGLLFLFSSKVLSPVLLDSDGFVLHPLGTESLSSLRSWPWRLAPGQGLPIAVDFLLPNANAYPNVATCHKKSWERAILDATNYLEPVQISVTNATQIVCK